MLGFLRAKRIIFTGKECLCLTDHLVYLVSWTRRLRGTGRAQEQAEHGNSEALIYLPLSLVFDVVEILF